MSNTLAIKQYYAKKWLDPVKRIEDIFRVRRGDGTLVPLVVPEPQRQILRDGILGKGKEKVKKGLVVRRIINKGRQIGYSVISAAEAILIAMDYPNTFQYYVATKGGQAADWLFKLNQLVLDAKNWPTEAGGGPILTISNMKPIMKKVINNCEITGFAANPPGMRGPTGIAITLDEYAWMILYKNQQEETYTACKHFVSQGGQLSILSTPRTTTDKFMEIYGNSEKHGFISYYCPTITNWKELELDEPFIIDLDNEMRNEQDLQPINEKERQVLIEKYSIKNGFTIEDNQIKQSLVIPYPWKSIYELEKDRRSDPEMFKQENLGIAVDERFKVLKGEWIYNNVIEGQAHLNRRDSVNEFVFGIDIAKMVDLFIVTVFEKIEGHWWNRYSEIMPPGQDYPVSARRIEELYDKFLPTAIRVDATGGGIVFCDILENTRMAKVLQRIIFGQNSKANMAETLRNVARDNKLHMLNNTREEQLIIRHLLKVERRILESSTKYTGKDVDKEGRDDGFWSVALAVCDNPHRDTLMEASMLKASFGSTHTRGLKKSDGTDNKFLQLKKEISQITIAGKEVVPTVIDEDAKKFKLIYDKLNVGLLPCIELKKPIEPLQCVGCENRQCPEWDYHNKICKSFFIDKEELKAYIEAKNES